MLLTACLCQTTDPSRLFFIQQKDSHKPLQQWCSGLSYASVTLHQKILKKIYFSLNYISGDIGYDSYVYCAGMFKQLFILIFFQRFSCSRSI